MNLAGTPGWEWAAGDAKCLKELLHGAQEVINSDAFFGLFLASSLTDVKAQFSESEFDYGLRRFTTTLSPKVDQLAEKCAEISRMHTAKWRK